MAQAWGDLSRHLHELNIVRGSGFSGGTDVGVPEGDHRARWAPDAPLNFYLGMVEIPGEDDLGGWNSKKGTSGIHDSL